MLFRAFEGFQSYTLVMSCVGRLSSAILPSFELVVV